MITFELPGKAITAKTLERLKEEKIKEGLQLEYKESLPTEKTREKFLTSITSFANSSGGDIIYGIRAKRDDDGIPTGEPESILGLPGINVDQEKLRLLAMDKRLHRAILIGNDRIGRPWKRSAMFIG